MNRFKTTALCFLCSAALGAFAADAVSIRGTVRTADKTRGEEVRIGRHSVQSGTRSQFLEMELKAVQPSAATNVRVSWIVLVQPPKGSRKDHVAARGEQSTNLTRTTSARLESEVFTMIERDVQHRGKAYDVQTEVSAWGVKVEDLHGNLLAERIEPERAAAQVRELWEPRKRDR